ncbi:MAG: type II toxin-antitoxin system VapC family toxin [Acidobacteriaceae bacterium]
MILLDTHAAVWLLLDPERLSPAAAKIIKQSSSENSLPAISSVSFYEIARALHRGRIQSVLTAGEFLRRLQTHVRAIAPTMAISLAAARLPAEFPNDPMDRIIAATAIIEGLALITADRHIRRSQTVKTIW